MPLRYVDHDDEEGQVVAALLVVVVVLLFLALAFFQIGSAAEQKTLGQTATDAAAIRAAHGLQAFSVPPAAQQFAAEHPSAAVFATSPPVPLDVSGDACSAAVENWDANPAAHRQSLGCGAVSATEGTGEVSVHLEGPADDVTNGPVDASAARVVADATARVVLDQCPDGLSGPALAAAHVIADRMATALGASSNCTTPDDETRLDELDDDVPYSFAAYGPPGPTLIAVRDAFRVELVR